MSERKGVKDRLREESIKLGMKAVSRLMEDPDRAQMVMGAVQKVQQGKESLDDVTGRLRNLADLPSRDDFKDLGKLVGKLRREVRKLKSQVDEIAEKV